MDGLNLKLLLSLWYIDLLKIYYNIRKFDKSHRILKLNDVSSSKLKLNTRNIKILI